METEGTFDLGVEIATMVRGRRLEYDHPTPIYEWHPKSAEDLAALERYGAKIAKGSDEDR